MTAINFHNKTFSLIENSDKGSVTSDTVFTFQQDQNLVTADYHGGSIKYGKIIAHLEGEQLQMLYQCMTITNELKAGKAIALISLTEQNKLRLNLNWEWLGDKKETGVSEYIEN